MSTITDLETARALYRKHRRAPVPAEGGGSMKGVTVRQIGDERPPVLRPRNLIEAAAMVQDRDAAASLLIHALGIKDTGVCVANLSDPLRWARIPVEARLDEIGHWLRAECFEAMDLCEFDKPANMTLGD